MINIASGGRVRRSQASKLALLQLLGDCCAGGVWGLNLHVLQPLLHGVELLGRVGVVEGFLGESDRDESGRDRRPSVAAFCPSVIRPPSSLGKSSREANHWRASAIASGR